MKTSTKTGLASAGVLVLTLIHHSYGTAIYDTPSRRHVALVVLPVLLAMVIAYVIHRRRALAPLGSAPLWVLMVLTLAVPVGVIGILEGAYNHLAKDVLFFVGMSPAVLDRLFPESLFEMPDDLLFEVSGVLQFFIGLYAGFQLRRLSRERTSEPDERETRVAQAA